ncbi:MAG TPA: YceI family protein, partial [Bacillota bacterium]|nr:YceI family protein [Bacillota bacterium]
ARQGSKVRIEGTSNIHDWQVESLFVGGFLEVDPGFPLDPGQAAKPGKLKAQAQVAIPVRSLKSVEKDGKPYNDKMDEIMWEKLKLEQQPKILYYLRELALKETPQAKDAPYILDSKGELVVAGVTNTVSMPVSALPLGDKKLKLSGSTTLKMTSFGIDPPAPKWLASLIKTGDDVKIIFEWIVAPKTAPVATASK